MYPHPGPAYAPPPPPAAPRPRTAPVAMVAIVVSILGILTTFPLFGVACTVPISGWIASAIALRVLPHDDHRSRSVALVAFALGGTGVFLNVGLLALVLW